MPFASLLNAREDGEAPWRQMVRTFVAVAICWIIGETTGLVETTWSLITALIVTQSSIDQTVSTARDQIVGTVIGAVVGTLAITAQLFIGTYWTIFWIALAPLAYLAAIRPSLRFAGVTLMIVYLLPARDSNPYWPLTERLTAIFLGVIVSLIVSFVVLHASARRRGFLTASRMFREMDELLQAALRREEMWSELEDRNDQCARKLLVINDCVAEAYHENWGLLEKRHPILSVLPALMRRMLSDTMLVARAINAGKDRGGFSGVAGLHTGLSHAYRSLARRCEIHAAGKAHETPFRPGREDVLSALPTLGQDALPEMHFVIALLRQDLRRATDVLMSEPESRAKDLRAMIGK
ncbi:FUSC family protein [Asaia astilbis]|uniref:FUSC family protein n=1 Tax=Asaia astilbis TaxID=610244 RepID=UPI0004701F55|nr:FUSC family protein [Asaia astilbis]